MIRWMMLLLVFLYSCQDKQKQEPKNENTSPPLEIITMETSLVDVDPVPDYDTLRWKEITKEDHGIYLDIKYATEENFTGIQIYECSRCFLRPILAERLIKLQKIINHERGWSIKVYDCYRPIPAQQKLWDKVPNATYVTPPEKGSMHNRGMAVDLTLVDEKGENLDMGSTFDSFTRQSHTDYMDLSQEILDHRKILAELMAREQLVGIRTEWWHFSLRTSLGNISNWEWECDY